MPAGVEEVVLRLSVAMFFPLAVSLTITLVLSGEVEFLTKSEGPLATVGETDAVRFTLTGYPARLPRVIVEVVFDPAGTFTEAGVAVMLKETTLALTVLECRSFPLVPTTLIE